MNLSVIHGLVMRYLFLYTRNWVRLVELIFWPTMELLVWGNMTHFVMSESGQSAAHLLGYLIGGVILWDVLFRAQQAVALSMLEDVWTRNLVNIFVAPIRPIEYLTAGIIVGVLRIAVTVILLAVLAALSFQWNVLVLHWHLVPFFANLLLFGWALGMVSSALIMKWGQAAESLAWAVPFLIQPIAAVSYSVATLPTWAQYLAWSLPGAHVFEGMREVIRTGSLNYAHLGWAFGLNIIYLFLAGTLYIRVIEAGRRKGTLTKVTTH